MPLWLHIFSLVVAVLVAIPLFVFAVECLVGLLPARTLPTSANRPSLAVLIPAHNEERVLGDTLRSVSNQLGVGDRLVVVADNCRDQTAAIGAQEGAQVLVRQDEIHRGKGYALAFGLDALRDAPPEVVLLMDADCIVSPDAIDTLARTAAAVRRPVQAIYTMDLPPQASVKDLLSALAFMIKNRARPLGLHRLGMPCLLTGTGMAFPWAVLQQVSLASGNIVEDMQLGIDLTHAGHAPRLCPRAFVRGVLPAPGQAALTQRKRWEHGHLQTLLHHGPRLLWAGLQRRRPELLALAADLCVPPLSLLVGLWALTSVAAVVLAYDTGAWSPAAVLLTGGGLMALALGLAWFKYARRQIPFRALLAAPMYILWKAPLYLTFLTRRQKAWVRTQRPS